MVPEDGEVLDAHDPTQVGLVPLPHLGQDGNLQEGLLHQLLTPLRNLHGQVLLGLVVEHLDHLPERALVDRLHDLVSVSDVVSDHIPVELPN